MRISSRVAAVFLLVLFSTGAGVPAVAGGLPASMAAALKRAAIPAGAVGLSVQEVGAGKTLAAANAAQPFSPASTIKLVTTDAALELLGPTFTWKTQAFAAAAPSGDVLPGDLVIKGGGDPKLVMENFWLFLRQIRARGIREIRGNLVLDRSVFLERPHDAAQFDGDPMKPYNAGPDALLLNFQSFRLRFNSNDAARQVQVTLDPPAANFPVGSPKWSNDDCGDWKDKLRARVDAGGAQFAGSFSSQCGEKVWYIHPPQMSHTQYFKAVFSQMWSDLGGSFKGEVVGGTVPPGARLLAEWESPALPEAIRDINKFSNNVMARQVLLTLGADDPKIPADPERGAAAVKKWLAAKGIEAPELVIENGSGLSRRERIAPATMTQMLVAAFHSPLMPEFMSSMPLAGYDGTMRNRVKQRGVAGNAHIKTGSLDDVRSMAGYVLAASGKRYAVACFINHRNAGRGQEALDALLEWVYEHG